MIVGGALYRAPISEVSSVLDLGTGTGAWAIDMAEYVLTFLEKFEGSNMNTQQKPSSDCYRCVGKVLAHFRLAHI
jgi:hypothetical protein